MINSNKLKLYLPKTCYFCNEINHIAKDCEYKIKFNIKDDLEYKENFNLENENEIYDFLKNALNYTITFMMDNNNVICYKNNLNELTNIESINNMKTHDNYFYKFSSYYSKIINFDHLRYLNCCKSIEDLLSYLKKVKIFNKISYTVQKLSYDEIVSKLAENNLITFDYLHESKRDNEKSIFIKTIKSYFINWNINKYLHTSKDTQQTIIEMYAKLMNLTVENVNLLLNDKKTIDIIYI